MIFFSSNILSAAQLRAVIGELQRANVSSPIHAPLLMLLDQEGGLVRRLPGPPTLSEKAIGANPRREILAADAGRQTGESLVGAGITVNLAPVLDVFKAPGNLIDQYQRTYSNNPAVVGRLGQAFVAARQQTGGRRGNREPEHGYWTGHARCIAR